jgi:hypothetical protein
MVVSVEFPMHKIPPLAGEGLLQVLDLVWMPPPHVFEQDEKSDHSLHSPSYLTKTKSMKSFLFMRKSST